MSALPIIRSSGAKQWNVVSTHEIDDGRDGDFIIAGKISLTPYIIIDGHYVETNDNILHRLPWPMYPIDYWSSLISLRRWAKLSGMTGEMTRTPLCTSITFQIDARNPLTLNMDNAFADIIVAKLTEPRALAFPLNRNGIYVDKKLECNIWYAQLNALIKLSAWWSGKSSSEPEWSLISDKIIAEMKDTYHYGGVEIRSKVKPEKLAKIVKAARGRLSECAAFMCRLNIANVTVELIMGYV